MKQLMALALAVAFLASFSVPALAEGPSPTMYTLEAVYYYLIEGVEPVEGGHDLTPPEGSVPGDIRFKSLKQIYEDILALLEQCEAGPENVRPGKVFFSTQTESWGPQTGTAPVFPAE